MKLKYPKLQPQYEDGEFYWLLIENFVFETNFNGTKYRFKIKKGFDFDGASIPRAFRTVVGDKMSQNIIVAALFHDCFYCVHSDLVSRSKADEFFRETMKLYGATWVKRWACWSAVRTFGGFCWPKTDEEIERYKKFLVIEEIFE